MMAVTKSLSKNVHHIKMKDETEEYQFVPQLSSTLRLDLVFWECKAFYFSFKQYILKNQLLEIQSNHWSLKEIILSVF